MTSTIYGLISDVHTVPSNVVIAIEYLKNQGATKLILNGDIGQGLPSIKASRAYIKTILQAAANSELETFVQPGSHERMSAYLPVIWEFAKNYPNIINVLDRPYIEGKNHNLLFIPGSDSLNTGEFQINTNQQTGPHLLIPNQTTQNYKSIPIPEDELPEILELMHPGQSMQRYFINLAEIAKKVTDGEKTLAICHVPSKSNNRQIGIDVAYFGRSHKGEIIPGIVLEQQIIRHVQELENRNPSRKEIYHIANQNGIQLQIDNVGNEELSKLYKTLGITRAINGHIHEAGHRAHTFNDQPIKENEWTKNLKYNSGCLDQNQCGLLEIDENNVRYHNVRINEQTNINFALPQFSIQQTGESMPLRNQVQLAQPHSIIIPTNQN